MVVVVGYDLVVRRSRGQEWKLLRQECDGDVELRGVLYPEKGAGASGVDACPLRGYDDSAVP
jgi:hypothetical protein